MANPTKYLTSIFPDHLRSGPSPGRRLLALALCAMLVLGSIFPGVSLAGETDSEGEGVAVELPELPDLDPGGEETDLTEEVPASGGGEEEGEAVEVEPEVDTEAPPSEEVTSAATEAPGEAPPQPVAVPEPTSSPSEPELPAPAQQAAAEPPSPEPVANQSITAPKQVPARHSASSMSAPEGTAPPAEPAQREAPPPQPVAAISDGSGRNLTGKDIYRVRPGDCLWAIAAELLPPSAGSAKIAQEVRRLWRLNASRIGTGDPNLLMVGTALRLR
jgi:outer membrane biosynthesis protein TonB